MKKNKVQKQVDELYSEYKCLINQEDNEKNNNQKRIEWFLALYKKGKNENLKLQDFKEKFKKNENGDINQDEQVEMKTQITNYITKIVKQDKITNQIKTEMQKNNQKNNQDNKNIDDKTKIAYIVNELRYTIK